MACANSPPFTVSNTGTQPVYVYTDLSQQWTLIPAASSLLVCLNGNNNNDWKIWLNYMPAFGDGYYDLSPYVNIPKPVIQSNNGSVYLAGDITEIDYYNGANGVGGNYTLVFNAPNAFGSGFQVSDGNDISNHIDLSVSYGYATGTYTSQQMGLPGSPWITLYLFPYASGGGGYTSVNHYPAVYNNIVYQITDTTATYYIPLVNTPCSRSIESTKLLDNQGPSSNGITIVLVILVVILLFLALSVNY